MFSSRHRVIRYINTGGQLINYVSGRMPFVICRQLIRSAAGTVWLHIDTIDSAMLTLSHVTATNKVVALLRFARLKCGL